MLRVKTMGILATLVLPATALAQNPADGTDREPGPHTLVKADGIIYEPLEVPGFDSGVKLAVLHGNPMDTEGDYAIRLWFPDGYRFPAHYHPKAEHLTVLSGTLLLGMGTSGDESAMVQYAPGAFLFIPAEDPHYGGAQGETTIQLHGRAPFEIILSNAGS